MSIFSSIKKSRQSARSHNAKMAEQKKAEESATPYKHVPTHAASDAIASAPPSWREADKVRIVEQNRRRSAMAASGHHMNMSGTPRVNSSLSYVAYPSDGKASPMVPPIPRAYSHTGVANLQSHMMYGVPHMAHSQPVSLKGKEVIRWPIHEATDQDPGYGKDAQSVAESSSESSSSHDNLEMRSAHPNTHAMGMGETRWHSSPTRSHRKSDPLIEHLGGISSNRSSQAVASTQDPRPPPSTRGFSAVPSSTSTAPSLGAILPAPLPATVLSGSRGLAMSPVVSPGAEPAVQSPIPKTSRASSAASLPALTPTSLRVPPSAPTTPKSKVNASFEFPFPSLASPNAESDSGPSAGVAGPIISPFSPTSKPRQRRASRPTRFTELERIESAPEGPHHSAPRMNPHNAPSPLSHAQVVNMFPEAVMAVPEACDGNNFMGKRPRKAGNKLLKKARVPSFAGGS